MYTHYKGLLRMYCYILWMHIDLSYISNRDMYRDTNRILGSVSGYVLYREVIVSTQP